MLPSEVTESTDPIDETEEIRRRKRSIEQNHTFKEVRLNKCSFKSKVLFTYALFMLCS